MELRNEPKGERENNGDGGRGETMKKHKLSGRWQREQGKSNRSLRVERRKGGITTEGRGGG